MKPKNQRIALAALAGTIILTGSVASAADLYWKTATASSWSGAFWGTAPGGPYDQPWASGSNVVFEDSGGTTLTITGATTDVGSITANENVTVTASSTLGTGGNIATITVASGKTLNFQGQALSVATGTGFIKTGDGTLSLTGSAYPGGLTISGGTVAAGGVNALGSGGVLTLNGGVTLRSTSTTARDFSNKPSGVTVGGNFTLGDVTNTGALTFNAPVALGAATRTITLNSAATFNGVISGDAGVGLTKGGSGQLTLGGANTYDGPTTVTAGTLALTKRTALYNGDSGQWTAGNVIVNTGATLAMSVGGTGEFSASDVAILAPFTASLGLNTASANFTYPALIAGGSFTKLGGNTLTLTGANTYGGGTTIGGGTLQVNSIGNNSGATVANLGSTGGISFTAAATLAYAGTGETTDRVVNFATGSGGTLSQLGTGPLVFSSDMTGAAASMGVTLTGTGVGEINGIADTTAQLNLNKTGGGKWTVNGTLTLNGGNLRPQGGVLAFSSGAATVDNGILTLGNRANAGVVTFATGSSVRTASPNTNGILGAWATVGDSDWAKTNGSGNVIDAFTGYTNDTWAAGTNTNVTLAGGDPTSGSTTNTLRIGETGAKTLALTGVNSLGGNGILVTPNVGANATTITGGTVAPVNYPGTTAGATVADLVIQQHNTAGELILASVVGNAVAPAARTGTVITTAKTVTGLSSTADLVVGMSVTGSGIPASSTIASINSATQITLNNQPTVAGSPSLTFGTSANGLTKAGAGTLVFGGTNTYTGATTVHEGTVNYNNNYSLSNALNINRGTVNIKLATTLTEGGNIINFNANGATLGTHGTGANALINTFDVNSVDFNVAAGVTGASIASTINVLTATYGTRIVVNAGATLTMNGIITGSGKAGGILNSGTMIGTDSTAIYYQGAGNLVLTGANTFNAGGSNVAVTSIQAGTITLTGGDNRLPAGSAVYLGATTNTSGRLVLNGVSQTLTGLNVIGTGTASAVVGGSATTSTLTVNNTNTYNFGGAIGGTGANENNLAFAKSGAGVMALTGANTYAGGTTVNAGTLRVANTAGSATGTGAVAVNGGTVDGTGIITGTVTVAAAAGSVTPGVGGTGTLTLSNLTFTGPGAINFVPGATRLDVTGDLTASGGDDSVSINIGTVPLAAGTYHLVSHPNAILGTGLDAFAVGTNPGGPFTYTLVDSGGYLDLQVATSAVFWKGGIDSEWSLAKANWAVSGSPVYFTNGTEVVFDDSADLVTVDVSVANVSPGSMTFSNITKDYTVTGSKSIAGTTGLLKGGAGIVTISNVNSFTGAVTLNHGTIEADSIANGGVASALGAGTSIVLNGGTLSYLGGAAASSDRGVMVNGASTLDLLTSNLTLTGFVDGTGTLTKTGAGTLVLANAGNSLSGDIVINGGAVAVDDLLQLGSGAVKLGGGKLVLGGTAIIPSAKALTLNSGGGTVQVDNPAGVTQTGTVTGSGGLTKKGTGTLTLQGNKSFSGGVTVDEGTLYIAAGGWYINPFGLPNQITVNAGGTLETAGTHTLGVDANPVHINGGTLKLAAENYISGLQMTGGKVTGGQLRTWGGTMTFNASAGGALIESPSFQLVGNTTLSVADGAAATDLEISAGIFDISGLTKTGDGSLTLSGINTYAGNTTVNAGSLNLAAAGRLRFVIGAASGTANSLTGAGAVTLDGKFTIDTTAASALTAGTWLLENVPSLTGSYGATFGVVNPDGSAWTDAGGDKWTKADGSKLWTFDETTGTLSLTVSGYGSWAATNAPGQTAAQDYDGDGVSNGVEYVLGGSKDTNDLGKLPAVTTPGGDIAFTFKRAQTSKTPDVTLDIVVGTTLGAWPDTYHVGNDTAGSAAGVTVTGNGDGTDTVELKILRAPDAAKFARLKVTVN